MKRILSFLVVLFLATTVTATIRLVPQQYSTIQAGINAANPGDTVLVAAGVYVENLLMREGVSLFGSGMDKTIVDGGGLANVITSPYNVLNLVISDLSARNSEQSGSAPGCIGIHLNPNSSSGTKVVRRCHVYHCGHGIQVWNDFGGTVTIEDNVIDGNLYDGFYPYLGTVYLLNNTIVNNGRDGYNDWSGGGGGVYIQNNIIANNGRYGIYKHQNTPVYISYNDIWNNAQGAYMQGYSGPAQPFIPQPGTGEIALNPLFIGSPYPLHAQFYITWNNFPTPDSSKSPCIDAGNPAAQFNDPDGTRGDMGALCYDQRVHNMEISLVPVGLWVVPPEGGNLSYNITITNNENTNVTCRVWTMVTLPNGNLYGPLVGPAEITVPANSFLTRQRTQYVPASAPPGQYLYQAIVGNYPTHFWDFSSAPFTKQAGEGAPQMGDWSNTGDSFDEPITEPLFSTSVAPQDFNLLSAFPNPFNATTAISYKLQAASKIRLDIFDVSGKLVRTIVDGWREAGAHQVTFDGSGLPSGVYLYKLEANGFTDVQKMVLLK